MDLHCPYCGASDEISSLDRYYGTCAGAAKVLANGTREFDPGGYTEINWDSGQEESLCCGNCYGEFKIGQMLTDKNLDHGLALSALANLRSSLVAARGSDLVDDKLIEKMERIRDTINIAIVESEKEPV